MNSEITIRDTGAELSVEASTESEREVLTVIANRMKVQQTDVLVEFTDEMKLMVDTARVRILFKPKPEERPEPQP